MEKEKNPLLSPYLATLLGVVAAAFSSIFTKLAAAPPLAVAFYRLFLTVALISPFVVAQKDELRAVSRRDLALALLAGLFLALHFASWITSLSYTSIASSTVLVTMQPLFVLTGGYLLFREKVSPRGLVGAALALLGSAVIGWGDFRLGGQAFLGDVLAFAGAAFVAGYVLIGRSLRRRLSLLSYVFLVYGASAAVLLLANLAAGVPLYPYPPETWLWFFLLALVPTIGGHTVFNWALRYVKAAVVSVSNLGEPVGATILAYLIFHQVPALTQLLGGAVIIGGLALFILTSAREGENP